MAVRTAFRFGFMFLVTAILVGGLVLLGLYLQQERTRDLARWNDKLNLIADSRSREVSGWVQNQFEGMTALANNAALQLYFTSLQNPAEENAGEPPAQGDYLRNLLTITAERLGFTDAAPTLQQQVMANVRKLGKGGLALVTLDGSSVTATDGMPPLDGSLAEQIRNAPRGTPTLLDIEQAEDGSQRMGFIVPIYGIQAEHTASAQIGSLVAIRPVNEALFNLLTPEPVPQASLQVALVRAEGDNVRYLTPLKDASPLMSRSEENNASMAAAHALSKPNSFASKLDYTGSEVLVTSRSITGTPWALLVKVDRAEALAETAQWRNTVAAAFVLLLLAIIASIVAINARRSAAVAAEAASRATLLATVTNNQPEPLYIVDEQLAMQFANQQTASLVGVPAEELQGKSLANMMGQAFAEALRKPVQRALETKRPQTAMLTREEDGAPHAICARFVPMDSIPLEGLEDRAGVLVVEQDITEALREREKRLGTLQQLIGTLVSMVDRRDPNAAQHSSAVASVATAIAEEMNLDPVTVETTGTAARLMNLGKMDIPTEWLTRADKLSDKERLALRSTNLTSAELLEGIAFEGPVAETVRQSQEHVDGSGPLKLQGDTILISARIIAAANALVGMVSPRTYRAALPISEAETVLMQDSDTRFDRRVVIALMHYLDNRGGREALQTMMQVAAPARKNA